MTTVGLLSFDWKDEFMAWNVSEYGNIGRIMVPASNVWTPEFGIYNSAEGNFFTDDYYWYDVAAFHYGHMTWLPAGRFITTCEMQLGFFPFDNQKCSIQVANWMEHAGTINFMNATTKVETSFSKPNSEWDLLGTEVKQKGQFYGAFYNGFIEVSFHLQRRSTGYVLNIVIPVVILSILGLLVFLLPPDSGEKVSLSVTLLLAFSVFQLIISEKLPSSFLATPVLLIFVMVLMVTNGASLVMTVVVLNFHHKSPDKPMPSWLRAFVFKGLARIVCKYDSSYGTTKVTSSSPGENDIRVLEVEKEINVPVKTNEIFGDQQKEMLQVARETLKELRRISKKIDEDAEEGRNLDEWKRAAVIIDRLFFIICALFIAISIALLVYYFVING